MNIEDQRDKIIPLSFVGELRSGENVLQSVRPAITSCGGCQINAFAIGDYLFEQASRLSAATQPMKKKEWLLLRNLKRFSEAFVKCKIQRVSRRCDLSGFLCLDGFINFIAPFHQRFLNFRMICRGA